MSRALVMGVWRDAHRHLEPAYVQAVKWASGAGYRVQGVVLTHYRSRACSMSREAAHHVAQWCRSHGRPVCLTEATETVDQQQKLLIRR